MIKCNHTGKKRKNGAIVRRKMQDPCVKKFCDVILQHESARQKGPPPPWTKQSGTLTAGRGTPFTRGRKFSGRKMGPGPRIMRRQDAPAGHGRESRAQSTPTKRASGGGGVRIGHKNTRRKSEEMRRVKLNVPVVFAV